MKNMMNLLEDVSLQEQWRRIVIGLHSPKDSGARRYAINTIQHIFGPSGISIAGSLMIALIALNLSFDMDNKKIILPELTTITLDPIKDYILDPAWEATPKEDKSTIQPGLRAAA